MTPPLVTVKERFGTKEALVNELAGMVKLPDDEAQDDWKARLRTASNSKLLRLHARATEVTERFGGREALLDAVCKLKFGTGKVEDAWREKASGWSDGRLLDVHRGLDLRAKRAA